MSFYLGLWIENQKFEFQVSKTALKKKHNFENSQFFSTFKNLSKKNIFFDSKILFLKKKIVFEFGLFFSNSKNDFRMIDIFFLTIDNFNFFEIF